MRLTSRMGAVRGGPGAPTAVRAGRLLFAVLDIVALVVAVTDTRGSLVNFFSFFTIESNLLAIVVLLLLAGALLDPRGSRWPWLRGAARSRSTW